MTRTALASLARAFVGSRARVRNFAAETDAIALMVHQT